MLNKKFIILTVLISLLAISAVSASDNTTNDTLAMDSTNNAIATTPNTFTDLNKLINDNSDSTIELSDDYTYNSNTDYDFKTGITISRDVTINGNGHTLDGDKHARIFKITEGCKVIFNNINFIHGCSQEDESMGGAIYGNYEANYCNFTTNSAKQAGGAIYGGTANHCTFTNNYALNCEDGFGGAIYNGTANYCNFVKNSADYGGAIYKVTANHCTFTQNYARSLGGAIAEGTANNCKFINNSAEYGGATYSTDVTSSSFISNYAKSNGGAMYIGTAKSCTFNENSAKKNGGAMIEGIAKSCTFTGNYAVNYGGAMYKSTSYSCTFKDNTAKSGQNTKDCTINGKKVTTLTISPSTAIRYGSNFVITLKDSSKKAISGVKVTFYANGKQIATKITDKNGQIKISSSYFGIKTYTIKTKFAGDDNYKDSSKTIKITVKKGIPKITSAAKTFKKSTKTKKYSITLKNQAGKVMKYKKVTLKVNGRYYYAKTNAYGVATFKITILFYKCKFTATIRYSGSGYYNAATKKAIITVK